MSTRPWLILRSALPLAGLFAAACSADTPPTTETATDTADTAENLPDANDGSAIDASEDGVAADVPASIPGPNDCAAPGTDAATARCLTPTQTPEYYVAQAELYFDTLDVDAPPENIPDYSEFVARWEWEPWLLLTGYGRQDMEQTAQALRQFDPSTVPFRDCRFFEEQPFARCYVSFTYEGGPCPIYEEFVFNDAGETTFIEAWSDLDGLRPTSTVDMWAEAADFPRLSTRVPGLGRPDGLIDLTGPAMTAAAANDPVIADFVRRAANFWDTWLDEYFNAPDDFFAVGCGWETTEE
jgi:hypothetical protein